MIGKAIVETVASQPARSYLHADHLGSVRMVTDASGAVVQSLSYAGDYGATSIQGQNYSASDDSVTSFYRFQGQEQETFPLAKLGIDNDALSAWLDQIQLYHFPWRDYAAGLAAFLETDPVPAEDSLYAAFAANPANFTDETGGMITVIENRYGIFPEFREEGFGWPYHYTPANRGITSHVQGLLDNLREFPGVRLSEVNRTLLQSLRDLVNLERENPNNPFPTGSATVGERDPRTGELQIELVGANQRRRDWAERELAVLRQEQEDWLNTYEDLILNMWDSRAASPNATPSEHSFFMLPPLPSRYDVSDALIAGWYGSDYDHLDDYLAAWEAVISSIRRNVTGVSNATRADYSAMIETNVNDTTGPPDVVQQQHNGFDEKVEHDEKDEHEEKAEFEHKW